MTKSLGGIHPLGLLYLLMIWALQGRSYAVIHFSSQHCLMYGPDTVLRDGDSEISKTQCLLSWSLQ